MNRAILILNAVILVVNLILSIAATDSQAEIVASAARLAPERAPPRRDDEGSEWAYLRALRALERTAPGTTVDSLRPRHFEAIRTATSSFLVDLRSGVREVARAGRGRDVLRAYDEAYRNAKQLLEAQLTTIVGDAVVAGHLATAVVRSYR